MAIGVSCGIVRLMPSVPVSVKKQQRSALTASIGNCHDVGISKFEDECPRQKLYILKLESHPSAFVILHYSDMQGILKLVALGIEVVGLQPETFIVTALACKMLQNALNQYQRLEFRVGLCTRALHRRISLSITPYSGLHGSPRIVPCAGCHTMDFGLLDILLTSDMRVRTCLSF